MKGSEEGNIEAKTNIVKNGTDACKVLKLQFEMCLNPSVVTSSSVLPQQVGLCLFRGWHDG